LNRLGPVYEGLELGIAETNLIKAVSDSSGMSLAKVKSDLKSKGDLGTVAQEARTAQKMLFTPAPLTVPTMMKKLREVAKISGQSSLDRKVKAVVGMMVPCRDVETKFLVRCLSGKLRIGLAEQTVLTALANAFTTVEIEKRGEYLCLWV